MAAGPRRAAPAGRRGVRLIALVNPDNPTGALLDEAHLREIAAIAERRCVVVADEVYRGIDQEGTGTTPSFVDATSARSASAACPRRSCWRACGSAGSWPRARSSARHRHRDYWSISVGMVDDLLAAIALEAADAILVGNRAIVRANLAILDAWVADEPRSTRQAAVGHHGAAPLRGGPAVRGAVHPAARGRGRDVHAGQRAGHGGLPPHRLRERRRSCRSVFERVSAFLATLA